MVIVAYLFLLFLLMYNLFYSLKYLINYFKITKGGVETIATIDSFITYKHKIDFKNTLMPKLSFYDKNNLKISNIPVHSPLIELLTYKKDRGYKIFYNSEKPDLFVIENRLEVVFNTIVIAISIILCSYLLYKIIP